MLVLLLRALISGESIQLVCVCVYEGAASVWRIHVSVRASASVSGMSSPMR